MQMGSDVAAEIASALAAAMDSHYGGKPISQADLSRQSDVPQPTISRTLKGKTVPEMATLSKLIKVLGPSKVVLSPSVLSTLNAAPASEQSNLITIERTTHPNRHIAAVISFMEDMDDDGRLECVGAVEYIGMKRAQSKKGAAKVICMTEWRNRMVQASLFEVNNT